MLQGKPLSLLPLQTLIYYDILYSHLYFIVTAVLYIYKSTILTYPPNTISLECAGLAFFIFLQYFRLFIGIVGNKAEGPGVMIHFLVLTIPSIFGGVFFIALQLYVLIADRVMNIIFLIISSIEFILGIVVVIRFKKAESTR
ncbi:unnamed protein product [Blepharisma stoltei]|uniref:Transmembrane protein n=1 Tax=Blepharisma stoltei TaxID=1481888 RepID=A0AAU9IDW0_9CILI|nr:unnamed protein product [Blepharisma stoltei]